MTPMSQWDSVALGEVCEKIGSGATPRGGEQVYLDEGVSLIRSQNVYNGTFTGGGLAHISEEHANKLRNVTVESGDVLLNITGDSVARCCQVPDEVLPARVNQHVAIVRADQNELLNSFIKYFMISPRMQAQMLSLAGSGGTRKALTKEMIEGFLVPKPSRDAQERIVDILSAYDDLIENNLRRIKLLEESARLLYREWFVHLRFPGHEHVKIVDGVPEGWDKKQLGDVITLNYGKALKATEREEGDVPVYGSSGVVGFHSKPLTTGPGIIVGRKGNVGSVFWSSMDFFAIDTVYYINAEEVSYFLFHNLKHQNFINSDGAVPGLNRTFAYSQPIVLPSDTIRGQFEEVVTPCFSQIQALEQQNQALSKARDILLPRLMNGTIAV